MFLIKPYVMFLIKSLTSTHNLCFGAKIRKKKYPCIPQFCDIKVGFKGVNITRTCFPIVMIVIKFGKKPQGNVAKKKLNVILRFVFTAYNDSVSKF